MKKVSICVLFTLAVGIGTTAKADSVKPDDDTNARQSFRSMNAHHPHGFHLKYKKDDSNGRTDMDDFVWVAPGQSKFVQVKPHSFIAGSDSESTSEGLAAGKSQD